MSPHGDYAAAVVGSIRGLALEPSDVPVLELLTEVQALLSPFALAGSVSLVVEGDHAPAVVRGERCALVWVLLNLARNAVRFTPRGGRVTLSALVVSNAIELRVTVTRPGIRSSQLDDVFGPLVQANATDDEERRRAWLRLFIARDLTRRMGGELLVRSTTGVGSLVAVRFGGASHQVQESAGNATAKAA
jgi:signal transduction histidine kinase